MYAVIIILCSNHMSVLQLFARGGATVSGVGQEDNLILRPPPFFALWIEQRKEEEWGRKITSFFKCISQILVAKLLVWLSLFKHMVKEGPCSTKTTST